MKGCSARTAKERRVGLDILWLEEFVRVWDEKSCGTPAMTFPIKKRINTGLLIDESGL